MLSLFTHSSLLSPSLILSFTFSIYINKSSSQASTTSSSSSTNYKKNTNTMQEMMNCLNPSVLDRQRAQLQWQQHLQLQQDHHNSSFTLDNIFSHHFQNDQGLADGWPPNLTTASQYPIDKREQVEEEEEEELGTTTIATTSTPAVSNSTSSAQAVGKDKSSKKRKAVDKSPMVSGEEEEKRMKGSDSGNNSPKENNEIDKKPDYIHVRARRGQATDSHSLAERVRRERISERMKYLQGLVPGCNKITGKAGMLDEIINYVQSLQRQVEFLSMKLAAVNPRLDINMEDIFGKEMNLQCNSSISTVGEMMDPSLLQLISLQQAMAICGLDMAMVNPTDLALRRTISAPVSAPEPYLDSCLSAQRTTSSGWDNELHSLYGVEFHQGRGSSFPFHSLQGNILPDNLKREM